MPYDIRNISTCLGSRCLIFTTNNSKTELTFYVDQILSPFWASHEASYSNQPIRLFLFKVRSEKCGKTIEWQNQQRCQEFTRFFRWGLYHHLFNLSFCQLFSIFLSHPLFSLSPHFFLRFLFFTHE